MADTGICQTRKVFLYRCYHCNECSIFPYLEESTVTSQSSCWFYKGSELLVLVVFYAELCR